MAPSPDRHLAALSPNGSLLAFVARDHTNGPKFYVVAWTNSCDAAPCTPALWPCFSPDCNGGFFAESN